MAKLKRKHCILLGSIVTLLIILIAIGAWAAGMAYNAYKGPRKVVYVPQGCDDGQLQILLERELGEYGTDVYRLWTLRADNPARAHGRYEISTGDKAWSVAGRLADGRQSPVTLTFNNVRTMPQLAAKVSNVFEWDSVSFMQSCDTVLPALGYRAPMFMTAFLPDTYEFYWTDTPSGVIRSLQAHTARFWTDARKQKARSLGLDPEQVYIVASIAEEETNNASERGTVGRLYINRLDQGMKLQADPTVRYALNDFTIKRLYNNQTRVDSPYNTYVNPGLPPGPIRMVQPATIDTLLNAPGHDYLYMCARPDGSGRHNFAADYAGHQQNAKAYRNWLDKRGIR